MARKIGFDRMNLNWLDRLFGRFRGRMTRRRFLCDTCAYNHPNACRMSMRPNAILCEDYVPKGEKATRTPPPNLKF
jgi:hypothetical protein